MKLSEKRYRDTIKQRKLEQLYLDKLKSWGKFNKVEIVLDKANTEILEINNFLLKYKN